MTVSYNPTIVTPSLLVYIDAGNPRSYPGTGTVMYDLSGNRRDATVLGSPTFTNYYFTITSDSTYISLPSAGMDPGVGNFTYSIWMRFSVIDGSYDTLIEHGSWTDTVLIRFISNSVQIYADASPMAGSFAWTPTAGVWYNVVVIRESFTLSMYVNGVLTGTPFTLSTNIVIANPTVYLMRSQHSTGQFTAGDVSAFSMYGSALTPTEVIQNFNALKGRFGL